MLAASEFKQTKQHSKVLLCSDLELLEVKTEKIKGSKHYLKDET